MMNSYLVVRNSILSHKLYVIGINIDLVKNAGTTVFIFFSLYSLFILYSFVLLIYKTVLIIKKKLLMNYLSLIYFVY